MTIVSIRTANAIVTIDKTMIFVVKHIKKSRLLKELI